MADIYIYKITNPHGKIYIGQTVNLKIRLRVYERLAMPNQKKLFNSVKKYGWENHTVEILSIVSAENSDSEEIKMISFYDSINSGLNIMRGGSVKKTEEMNKKQALAMTGKKKTEEFKKKISSMMMGNSFAKGSVRSKEFKENLSIYYTGKKRTSRKYTRNIPVPKKPIYSYSMDGVFIKEYSSSLDVRQDGFDPTCVGKVCNGKEGRVQHKGVIFKFKDHG